MPNDELTPCPRIHVAPAGDTEVLDHKGGCSRNRLPGDVLLFSTADWDHPFWTNKQHTTVHLAKKGFRIVYVESLGLRRPTTNKRDMSRVFRRLVKGAKGLRQVDENIWVLSPLVLPFHGNSAVRKANDAILHGYLRLATRRVFRSKPIIWAYNPMVARLAEKLKPALLVYHCVDNLAAAPGMPSDVISVSEQTMLSSADAVFTTSPELMRRCSAQAPQKTHYFPNVADFSHFSRAREAGPIPEDLLDIPTPRIGFIGAISSYKVDFELISAVADKKPEWHWVMIGQVGEGQPSTEIRRLQKPNIHILGPRNYQYLPEYLRGFDVAVLPCPKNEYTDSMFPMKFFEYLSAGRPVVATDLRSLKDYKAAFRTADSPEAFLNSIQKVLDGDRPDEAACLSLAMEHTWDRRLDNMMRILESSYAKKSGLTYCAE